MDPIVTSALIGAGGSLLGGMMGGGSKTSGPSRQAYKRQREHTVNHYSAVVEGARRAGIHPLFALGGQAAPGVTMSTGSTSRQAMGEGVTRAAQHLARVPMQTKQSELMDAQIEAAKGQATRDHAEALLANSNAARTRQLMYSEARDFSPVLGVNNTPEGVVDVVPKEIPTKWPGKPHFSAGTRPGWMRVQISPNYTVDLPDAEEISEAIEGWGLPIAVVKNIFPLYKQWRAQAGRKVPQNKPTVTWKGSGYGKISRKPMKVPDWLKKEIPYGS